MNCAIPFDFTHPAHWRVQPVADARPVALADRGIPATGHFGRPDTCPACTPGARAPVGARMLPAAPAPRPVALAVASRITAAPAPRPRPSRPVPAPAEAPRAPARPLARLAPPEALPGPSRPAREPPSPGPVGRPLVEVFEKAAAARAADPVRRWRNGNRGPGTQSSIVLLAAARCASIVLGVPAPDRALWRRFVQVNISVDELVLAAWNLSPMHFGLRGHELVHPDSRRVLVVLSRRNGPVVRGHLARTRANVVRLTTAGLTECDALAQRRDR